MGDAPDASRRKEHEARVRALPLDKLRHKLIRSAWAQGYGPTAEDLANRALMKLFTEGCVTWDHAKDPEAKWFLYDAVEAMGRAAQETTTRRRTDARSDVIEEVPPSSDRGADRALLRRDEAKKAIDELLARLANNPLAVAIVRLNLTEGLELPADLAPRLNETLPRVYEAQKRIKREMDRMREERNAREGRPADDAANETGDAAEEPA